MPREGSMRKTMNKIKIMRKIKVTMNMKHLPSVNQRHLIAPWELCVTMCVC